MRKYILTIFLMGLIVSCGKDNQHPIPDVPIYLEYPICINDIEYYALLDVFGMVVLDNEGYLGNGIVVVNIGNNEFKAYDATCPYEIKRGCNIIADASSSILVKCICCGSKYEVTYGAVNKGPSNYPLKAYKTAFDGSCIRIYN